MAWQKNGTPDTLTVAGDSLSITDLTSLQFNVILNHSLDTGGTQVGLVRLEGDSGNNYANRDSVNGGADATNINDPQLQLATPAAGAFSSFLVSYIINISGEEKLAIGLVIGANTAGAANVPTRRIWVSKWVTASGQFSQVSSTNVGTGDFAIDSNLSALGTD